MKKILLVDDDQLLQTMYKDMLSVDGNEVDVAGTEEIAIEKLKSSQWDLILMDMILPQTTGLELVKKAILEIPEIKTTKIVFLTNLDDPKTIAEIQQLGYDYILKSKLNPDEFLQKIKEYLI
jgi:CheY-like chemotaxis protein